MKIDVILGLQWGDEGKGKIVDVLAPQYNVIARFQGGPNAGHTLEFDNIKHVLHQIPSGIFRKNTKNIIGSGLVLDPVILRKEIDNLNKYNLNIAENLYVSKKAQLILPTHRLLDAAYESAKGNDKIGSTLKGIGPTYQDKVARIGLRVGDILSDNFNSKYQKLVNRHKELLDLYNYQYDLSSLEDEFMSSLEFLKKFKLIDSAYMVNDCLKNGESILAEGAQGSLLDIDFGSYPFVTSSNTTTPGVCTGLGIAPAKIGEVFGIFKAYCTRVGSGPFPTELENEVGESIRKEGNEYGATTGRPRRCGWIDLPALKYAILINGVTQLIMTKADVLNIFKEINVCIAYKLSDGTVTDQLPYDMCTEEILPVYKTLPGWHCSTSNISEEDQFPVQLSKYITFLEEELQTPIAIVSLGPNRSQTIVRNVSSPTLS